MFNKDSNKIVITGASGFVGGHTLKALEEKGYKVFNYDIANDVKDDIRDIERLKEVIKEGDKVLHLAAIARFGQADDDPWVAYTTNVLGTKNVARVCKENKADRIVYSSTGSVYMPIEQEPPITEDFQCRGNSVYGCVKYLGELALLKESPPYIIFRYAHLYGEGRMDHGAIGGFLARMKRGLAPTLYGGKQSNDFTYIKDIVQANILALESDKLNEVYNIGTGQELSTEAVFEKMRDFLDYDKEFERTPARAVDPLRFVYDISKARTELGYNPEYDFAKGLEDYTKNK